MELELDAEQPRSKRLVGRMEAVLNAAQQVDTLNVELRTVGLADMVEGLDDLYRERLAAKGLTLRLSVEDLSVRAQPQLLRESVLGNLLSNAIKFAPLGSVITLSSRRVGGRVELSLSDEGPGIPDAVLASLAQGRRAPTAPGTRGEPGNGYGLGLAQDYLAQMGGELCLGRGRDGGTVAAMRLHAG